MINIIVVNHVAEQGGAENVLLTTLKHIDKHKFKVTAVLFQEGILAEEIRSIGIEVVTLAAGRIRNVLHYVRTVLQIVREIKRARADIVIGWSPKPFIYAGAAAWLMRKPVLWWQHGYPSPASRFDRLVSRLPAKAILCPSDSVAQAQNDLGARLKARVNYPGIETELFAYSALDREQIREKYQIPAAAKIITFIGRLQRWKRPDDVIEAFSRLQDEQYYLLVVGGALFGEERDYIQELTGLAERLGCADHVVFAGHQTEIAKYLSASDIVINASSKEPFGLVVVEAMANGRIVIAVNSGGPAEIIDHNWNGLLYDGSREGLYQCLLQAVKNDTDTQSIGRRALKTAGESFSAGQMVSRFEGYLTDLYNEAQSIAR
ncbi:glycosyltransferase family 4 protein [Paenibacillus sp. NPDC058174]|uniref:glycosyltransferase family 4 protein n=1 Tax=Paenibacillus sp. NPDC058174 TaxID=3346366 RepID=UPI0036DEF1AC